MSMLIRAELATANIVMNAKMPTGKAGAPAATTLSSGASSPRSAGATSVTEEIATST